MSASRFTLPGVVDSGEVVVPPVGARVAHIWSGALGTVIGKARPTRPGGKSMVVTVEWDAAAQYARPSIQARGSQAFAARLRVVDAP